ncbi:MAG TPA: DNA replication/repair protein RecF [Dehalococcoidia bacterium]
MHVRRLQLTNFRTYSSLDLEFEPGRLLFLGDNAQGKSNLLEAVYMLASGKSPRTSSEVELIGWQDEAPLQPFARLQALVHGRGGEQQVETIVAGPSQTPGARGGKRFRVNGIAKRGADFVGSLRAVLFTADDLEIISGPPATRRAYLDAGLSQVDRAYYASLQNFGRVMQQRNATLKRIRDGMTGPDELMLWDETFAGEAARIIARRQQAVQRLGMLAADAHTELSGTGEALAIAYEAQLGDEFRPLLQPAADAAQIVPLFKMAQAGLRRREVAAGISLVGPHRDDVSIKLNGVAAASFGSRAQIRTAALSLRLAEARMLRSDGDDPPVLLLDDIVSELDEQRRASVLQGVAGFDQVWFTATSGSWLPDEFVTASQRYAVRRGSVTRQ